MATSFETVTFAPVGAVTLVDRFAQMSGARGAFPLPIGDVQFSFVKRTDQNGAHPLIPPVDLIAQVTPSGVYRFDNEGTVGDRRLAIDPGRYTLRIASDLYQRAELDVDWPIPLAAMPVVSLLPGYAYPFPDLTVPSNSTTLIRGGLFEQGGGVSPVAGATVSVVDPAQTWPFASGITDDSGNWLVAVRGKSGGPSFAAKLHFNLPDGTAFDVAGVNLVSGADNSLQQTALRGAVVSSTGAPIANAVVTISGFAGSAVTDRDGRWSYYMGLLQADIQKQVTATAPNGKSQAQNVQVKNRATVVVPTFRLAMA
jgi:hypothetical protein